MFPPMIPRRNIILSAAFAVLAIVSAILFHTYAALALLVPLIALPFFLNRARKP
jgi:hypothetical protein